MSRQGSHGVYRVQYINKELVSMRTCLVPGHNHKFKSNGPQNRMCPEGRKSIVRSIDTATADRAVMKRTLRP